MRPEAAEIVEEHESPGEVRELFHRIFTLNIVNLDYLCDTKNATVDSNKENRDVYDGNV